MSKDAKTNDLSLSALSEKERRAIVETVERKTLEGELEKQLHELEETKAVARDLLVSLKDEQEELASAKAKDDALLASIGEGLVAVDKEGNITLINPSAGAMLGIKEGESIGGKATESFTPSMRTADQYQMKSDSFREHLRKERRS